MLCSASPWRTSVRSLGVTVEALVVGVWGGGVREGRAYSWCVVEVEVEVEV